MVNQSQLPYGFQPLTLIALLGNLQQSPGNRMFEYFPPFFKRLDDDIHPSAILPLPFQLLQQRLPVDVMLDVNVIRALPVNIQHFGVHQTAQGGVDPISLIAYKANTKNGRTYIQSERGSVNYAFSDEPRPNESLESPEFMSH